MNGIDEPKQTENATIGTFARKGEKLTETMMTLSLKAKMVIRPVANAGRAVQPSFTGRCTFGTRCFAA